MSILFINASPNKDGNTAAIDLKQFLCAQFIKMLDGQFHEIPPKEIGMEGKKKAAHPIG